MFGKRNKACENTDFNENNIQQEIRRRILKEAARRAGKENSEEATQATLDALEELVSLSREEMEGIAEQVRAEFKIKPEKPVKSKSQGWSLIWLALSLIGITYYLARRGSSGYLFTGLLLLLVVLFMLFRSPPPEQ